MRIFNNVMKKEYSHKPIFKKQKIINEILESRITDCPGWRFFRLSSDDVVNYDISNSKKFDTINCDFIAIYNDVINKEIRLKSNPFSEYKRTVESVYQIVRQIYITDENIEIEREFYKSIIAASSKELFKKLKGEV